ncbi:MAG: LAGLIDADG family homing endonuclease [Candidatus Diapherotrites archaeon]|nr:LAGLIDADG family homing endonuclease [Candidatus Diapherotrites archaeon]
MLENMGINSGKVNKDSGERINYYLAICARNSLKKFVQLIPSRHPTKGKQLRRLGKLLS